MAPHRMPTMLSTFCFQLVNELVGDLHYVVYHIHGLLSAQNVSKDQLQTELFGLYTHLSLIHI